MKKGYYIIIGLFLTLSLTRPSKKDFMKSSADEILLKYSDDINLRATANLISIELKGNADVVQYIHSFEDVNYPKSFKVINYIIFSNFSVENKRYTIKAYGFLGKVYFTYCSLLIQDSDGDKVPDDIDQCPSNAGPISQKGCPDSDGDGITDDKDECPSTPGNSSNGCYYTQKTVKITNKRSEKHWFCYAFYDVEKNDWSSRGYYQLEPDSTKYLNFPGQTKEIFIYHFYNYSSDGLLKRQEWIGDNMFCWSIDKAFNFSHAKDPNCDQKKGFSAYQLYEGETNIDL